MPKRSVRLLLACLLAPLAGFSHDITLFPQVNGRSVRIAGKYGHPGDYSAAVAAKLIELDAISPSGQKSPWVSRVKLEDGVLVASEDQLSPGTWVFSARYDNGYYVKDAAGRFINTSKQEVPKVTQSMHIVKYAKSIVAVDTPSGSYKRASGLRLELVPQADPFTLKTGQDLPVQVLFNGKPLPNVGVEIGDGATPIEESKVKRYQTDSSGIARVPVTRTGLQLIAVDYKTPSQYRDLADDESYSSTLTFILK